MFVLQNYFRCDSLQTEAVFVRFLFLCQQERFIFVVGKKSMGRKEFHPNSNGLLKLRCGIDRTVRKCDI